MAGSLADGPAVTGARLGRYELIARLASGGMGEVLLARMSGPSGFERLVVVKRLLERHEHDEEIVEMFLNEARIAARLNHPNVCHVYELDQDGGRYLLAMEYLEGLPLTTVIAEASRARRPLGLPFVTGIFAQACEGLHHAHELAGVGGEPAGLVHRDVTPGNLFLTTTGYVKLLDFGLARLGTATRARGGTTRGTQGYMSPEQVQGLSLDRRTDLFSLGVVLFEATTGRRLFGGQSAAETARAILTRRVPDLRALRPDAPAALAETVDRALARPIAARFPTARALRDALVKAVEPVGAEVIADVLARDFAPALEARRVLVSRAIDAPVAPTESDVTLVDLRALGPAPEESGGTVDLGPNRPSSEAPPATPPPAVAAPRRAPPTSPVAPEPSAADRGDGSRAMEAAAARPGPAGLGPAVTASKTAARAPRLRRVGLGLLGAGLAALGAAVALGRLGHPDRAVPDAAIRVAASAGDSPDGAPAEGPGVDAAAAEPGLPGAPPIRPPRRPAALRPGYLSLDAEPFATVYVDGRRIGVTPLFRVPLEPGRRRVKAVTEDGQHRSFDISVEADETVGRRLKF